MSSFLLKRSRSCSSLLSQNTGTKTTALSSTQLQSFIDSNQIHSRSPSGFSLLFIEVTKNPSGSNQNLAKACSFESRNLKGTTLASGYCILRQNILKSQSGFRCFATQAAVEPSTSDGLTVERIVANQWAILDESESDWKSHAAAIAQSIQVIKKRLQWKKLMVRLNLLSAELNKPNLWDDPVHAGKISREHGSLMGKMKEVKAFEQELLEHIDMIKLAREETESLKALLWMRRNSKEKELEALLSGEHDPCSCYIEVQTGTGGTESMDWASMVLQMYKLQTQQRGYEVTLVDEMPGEIAGIKRATIKVEGEYCI